MSSPPSLVLQPNIEGYAALELVGTTHADGIFVLEFTPPIPTYDEQYAQGSGTEGGLLTRSQAQNAVGSVKLRVVMDTPEEFWAKIDLLQRIFDGMRRRRGTLTETPGDGAPGTWRVQSIRPTGLPRDRSIAMYRALPELEFTCLPYVERPSLEVVAATTQADREVMRVAIPSVPGTVESLGQLSVLEAEGADRAHIEWGVCFANELPEDGELYAAAELTIYDGTLGGGVVTTDDLSTDATAPTKAVGTEGMGHIGLFKPKLHAHYDGTGPAYVRGVLQPSDGAPIEGAWQRIYSAQHEVDLGITDFPLAEIGTQVCNFWIEAYSETASTDLISYHLIFMPARRTGKVRATTAAPAVLYSGRKTDIYHDRALCQSEDGASYFRPPIPEGSYFRLPPSIQGESVLVVKARREDVDTEAYSGSGLADDLSVSVIVTPRDEIVSTETPE